jgi:hypothetical protein
MKTNMQLEGLRQPEKNNLLFYTHTKRKALFFNNGPLLLVLLCLTITVLWVLNGALTESHYTFTYALDDPYIHMATAKNLVEHGVWGVTKYNFSSATSSIVWPLLIAADYLVFGANDLAPLLMNVAFAVLLLWLCYHITRRYSQVNYVACVVLLAILFVTPVPALLFSGQEHILQAGLTIAFVYLATRILTRPNNTGFNIQEQFLVISLGVLDVATRYEGIFTALIVCILFAAQRKYVFAALLGILSLTPVVVFGSVSILMGSDFLPNSVSLKGKALDLSSLSGFVHTLGDLGYTQLTSNPHILWLVIACAVILYVQLKHTHLFSSELATMSAIFLGVTFLHMNFAATGWFYRYEAYLVALGLLIVAIAIIPHLPTRLNLHMSRQQFFTGALLTCLALLVMLPFLQRARTSLYATAPTMTDHYRQEYQMARFLNQFYGDKTVVLHDVGMVGYFSDVRQLDVWGLSSIEVARAKKANSFTTKMVSNLASQEDAEIAILYSYYLDDYGGTPSNWVPVGEWTIQPGGELIYPTITFYSVKPDETDKLIAHLKEFAPHLPEGIIQLGKYTEAPDAGAEAKDR